MAKSTIAGASNAAAEEEARLRPGISSLTSESRLGRSGPSGTPGLQSPAPGAESPSSPDPHPSPAPSSTAPSTSGSTRRTGSDPQSPQDSSEGSAAATPATPAPAPEDGGLPPDNRDPSIIAAELITGAHQAYEDKDYDLADSLLAEAEAVDPTVTASTAVAHEAIASAREADRKL